MLQQVGRSNPHPHSLGEPLNQHHDTVVVIDHLVDAFDTGKLCFLQADPLACLGKVLGIGVNVRTLRTQCFGQVSAGHLGWLRAKADKLADAFGRTNGCQVLPPLTLADEQVSWKQGFVRHNRALTGLFG